MPLVALLILSALLVLAAAVSVEQWAHETLALLRWVPRQDRTPDDSPGAPHHPVPRTPREAGCSGARLGRWRAALRPVGYRNASASAPGGGPGGRRAPAPGQRPEQP